MNKITNENVKKELLSQFPEFRESNEYKNHLDLEGGPYEYFARFADYVLNDINTHANTALIEKVFNFINELYARQDMSAEVWDLLSIELLETFEVDEKVKLLARQHLHGPALEAFIEQKGRPLG